MNPAPSTNLRCGLACTLFLAISTLLPCLAEDPALPAYKVGVLYDTNEAVVTPWKAAAAAAKTPIEVTGVSYTAAAGPETLLGFNCLVIPDSPAVPAALQPALGKFAQSGRDLILAGGLAFSKLPADQKAFTDLAFDPQERFQFKGDFSVRPWSQAGITLTPGTILPKNTRLSGASALGYAFPNQSSFHPLLEVVDNEGRREAWAAGLLRHTGGEFKGGSWLLAGIDQPEFYNSPGLLTWMMETARSYSAPAPVAPVAATPDPAPAAEKIAIGKDGHFVRPDGSPFFIIGANYCGSFDAKLEEFFSKQAFSPELLDAEFAKFHDIGINVMRSFSFGRMSTLEAPGDRVQVIRDCARRHGMYLLPEIGLKALGLGPLDITDNAKHAGAVARAYKGDPMLLGYDLANEPYITEVGSMTFHGQPSPIVQARPYETMADLLVAPRDKNWVDRQMQKTDGWLNLPKSIPADTKRELLAATAIWLASMKENGNAGNESTFPGFNGKIDIANSGKYAPFFTALNETFGQWIDEMSQAIRAEDPEALITIGYNRGYIALPVNEKLSFINNHIYQKPLAFKDTEISLGTYDRLHAMFPGKPITIGEFGLNNGEPVNGVPPSYQTQALWEILHYIDAYAHGYSGAMKWMDNDWTAPYIHRFAKWWTDPKVIAQQEQFGFFKFDGTPSGTPKPIAWCVKFFSDYLKSNPKPGELRVFETTNQVKAGFEYKADSAWFYGGEDFGNQAIRWDNPETKVVMVRWDEKAVTLMSTVDLDLEIDPKALTTPLDSSNPPQADWQKIHLLRGEQKIITRKEKHPL